MVNSKLVVMHLMTTIGETFAEGHDEVLDVHHDAFLYHAFINVFGIGLIYLLYVDEVKQILILEHLEHFHCQPFVGDGSNEIVGHHALVMVEVGFQIAPQCIFVPLHCGSLVDVEYTFFQR